MFFPELDNLLNSVANRSLGNFAKDFISQNPAVNTKERENSITIELAAPGLAKSDFQIALEKNVLKISVKKEQLETSEDVKALRKEFSYFNFERTFNLTDTIDTENISATYDLGILKVTLNKKPEASPKTIAII
jgi:HSP20 family protein